MTQKEIWAGYCKTAIRIIIPLHAITYLFNVIRSRFVRKPQNNAPKIKSMYTFNHNISYEEEKRAAEIRKILVDMMKDYDK